MNDCNFSDSLKGEQDFTLSPSRYAFQNVFRPAWEYHPRQTILPLTPIGAPGCQPGSSCFMYTQLRSVQSAAHKNSGKIKQPLLAKSDCTLQPAGQEQLRNKRSKLHTYVRRDLNSLFCPIRALQHNDTFIYTYMNIFSETLMYNTF